MLKKSLLLALTFAGMQVSAIHFKTPEGLQKSKTSKFFDDMSKKSFLAREIDAQVYPKAREFFVRLSETYPFLNDAVVSMTNPVSDNAFAVCEHDIIISQNWVEELQKENITMQNQIEWIILHEFGHLKYAHANKKLKIFGVSVVTIVALFFMLIKHIGKDPKSFNNFCSKYKLDSEAVNNLTIVGVELGVLLPSVLYSRWFAETQADDFANENCQNPEAFKQAKEFFLKAPNGLTHPTGASRAAKIDEALKKFDVEKSE